MTAGDRLPFQVTFRGSDPYESRLHQALRLLPRGYAKVVFLRTMRRVVPLGANVNEMRRLLEDVVTAPAIDMPATGATTETQEAQAAASEPREAAAEATAAAAAQASPPDSLML